MNAPLTTGAAAPTVHQDPQARVLERRRLVAAILVGVIGPEVFIVQPGFVEGLVQHLGFDERSAGYAAQCP